MTAEIRSIVKKSVTEFADRFRAKHLAERDDPEGVINQKVNNIFLEALGPETMFFNALSRSLDSSLGNMVEGMAIEIAKLSFDVSQRLEGKIYKEQTEAIGVLLERYKNSADPIKPLSTHANEIAQLNKGDRHSKRHESDYVLKHKETGKHYLIELKLGGDLDNKKARSEKEALLEQYCILVNEIGNGSPVKLFFATGYNRYGEGNYWAQGRVRQFFADDELLISSQFWNFVCDSKKGYEVVLDEYKANAGYIQTALEDLKKAYL